MKYLDWYFIAKRKKNSSPINAVYRENEASGKLLMFFQQFHNIIISSGK